MLSVLIPVYNFNILTLINSLHKQLTKANIDFEIICLDDVSDKDIIKNNEEVNKLIYTTYNLSKVNNGIAITRQLLCNLAKYEWVLLLDADTELKDELFISNYLEMINNDFDFIFGGFSYKNTPPQKDYLLRWIYGSKKEAVTAKKRNSNPYKITIAANLLAKKEVYKNLNLNSIGNLYAMDYYFGMRLKEDKASVLHIDNQVYHLGIEKSTKYLRKKEQATETLLKLWQENKFIKHSNSLLSLFKFSKHYGFNYLFAFIFFLFKSSLRKNLLGKNPSITILQFYKISYMCHFDLANKNHSID